MYVWEDQNHQNWDGERRITLQIQSLPKKKIFKWLKTIAYQDCLTGSSKYKKSRSTMQKYYSKRVIDILGCYNEQIV
jgi:Txe/YoeB family toxin of Txe-Axe toxin-antitoxin module